MPRSGVEARARLREAALELYLEHGYDATTAAQIAERAGVTERTYFRHFADKREVLFNGESELRDVMVGAIADAPDGTSPLALVVAAYTAAVPLFVTGRPIAVRRAEVIAVTPALKERAQAKTAALADAIVAALVARSIPDSTARLAAQVAAAAFDRAIREWYQHPRLDLAALIGKAADEVRALSG
jgi:AcrR family transcriptional regulator